MEDTENLILRAKYHRATGGVIVCIILTLLFLAAGISFLGHETAAKIAWYPLLSSLLPLGFGIFFFLREGRLEVTETEIRGGRRVGKKWAFHLDHEISDVAIQDITQINALSAGFTLYSRSDAKLVHITHVKPERFPPAFWMYFHYRKLVPDEVFISVARPRGPLKKSHERIQPVKKRTIWEGDKEVMKDTGIAVLFEDQWIYLPTGDYQSDAGFFLEMFSPVSLPSLKTKTKVPTADQLPIVDFVHHVLSAEIEEPEKLKILELTAGMHSGSMIPESARTGKKTLEAILLKGEKIILQF